jgi:hypothetical protein
MYNQWDSGVSRPEHPNEDSVLEPLGHLVAQIHRRSSLYSSIILAYGLLVKYVIKKIIMASRAYCVAHISLNVKQNEI